jgi:hypothetical protein
MLGLALEPIAPPFLSPPVTGRLRSAGGWARTPARRIRLAKHLPAHAWCGGHVVRTDRCRTSVEVRVVDAAAGKATDAQVRVVAEDSSAAPRGQRCQVRRRYRVITGRAAPADGRGVASPYGSTDRWAKGSRLDLLVPRRSRGNLIGAFGVRRLFLLIVAYLLVTHTGRLPDELA